MTRVLDKDTDKIEYFNIGTGKGNSTLEIVTTFERATGSKGELEVRTTSRKVI